MLIVLAHMIRSTDFCSQVIVIHHYCQTKIFYISAIYIILRKILHYKLHPEFQTLAMNTEVSLTVPLLYMFIKATSEKTNRSKHNSSA
jgi:hypothetical protein